jgi:probable rRNA maturation factor
MPHNNKQDIVNFYFQEALPNLRRRQKLRNFLILLFKNEKKKLRELNYVFCSDKFLLNINRHYLKHNYYTDVISFDLSNSPTEIVGEIYISAKRVKDNARQLRQPFQKELHRVIFHGALHLCGYEDKTEKEQVQMRRREDRYLQQYYLVRST